MLPTSTASTPRPPGYYRATQVKGPSGPQEQERQGLVGKTLRYRGLDNGYKRETREQPSYRPGCKEEGL